MTREQWLQEAADRLRERFQSAGVECPRIHASVGFPSTRGTSRNRRVIGQCWSGTVGSDGAPHVFISPVLHVRTDVLATLLHEMIHATVGTEHGHRGPFIAVARKVGFRRPWTSTPSSEKLAGDLLQLSESMPEIAWPHLTPLLKGPKVGSRYRLWECACGQKVRAATDLLEATHQVCGTPFALVG